MSGVVVVIQARMDSTRLPGKILAEVAGEPMLAHVVERSRALRGADRVVVATTDGTSDDLVARLCAERGWPVFRGSEEDVLDRYYRAAVEHSAEHVVRVTADCPLVDPHEGDRVIRRHLESGADYSHNITVWGSGMPLGTGIEIFTLAALERSWQEGLERHHREHVDEYVGDHRELFRIERVEAAAAVRRPNLRITVDTPEDLELVREIYARLQRPGTLVELVDAVALLEREPELAALNAHVRQKPI